MVAAAMSRPCTPIWPARDSVENRLLGIPGLLFEQAVPGGLHPQGDSGQTIGEEVDKQQMHRGEGDGQGQQGGI